MGARRGAWAVEGVSAGAGASASASVGAADGGTTVSSSSSAAAASRGDAGTGGCRVLRGPIELPVRAAAALALHGDSLEVALNDDGRPRILTFAAGAVPAAAPNAPDPPREGADGGTVPGYPIACAVAGDRVFCPDRTGAVHRAGKDGGGDRLVASSRTGTRVSASVLGGSHAAMAYLASRQTSEGWVSEAWLAVDDEPPVRISEDGAGATSLVLERRGASVLAVSVDARAALTALHVRPITFEGKAHLGEDVVAFVGGPGERRTTAACVPAAAAAAGGPPGAPLWALLPISKDIGSFGLAIVRIDEPARVDEPVVWSLYPNGLDPAPVAGAVEGGRTWVARAVPKGPEVGSPRRLELGTVAADGAFASHDTIGTTGKPTDVSLVFDAHGAAWLAWLDGAGSWLERLLCK